MLPLAPAERYVAYLDILGWSKTVLKNPQDAMARYDGILGFWEDVPHELGADTTIRAFSDSIVVVSGKLGPVLQAANTLQFTALIHDCLLRGGIAHGLHAERSAEGQLHVVSVPLIPAAQLEQAVEAPAVVVHESAMPDVDIATWRTIPPFQRLLLYWRGQWILNPFNIMWGTSGAQRVRQLRGDSQRVCRCSEAGPQPGAMQNDAMSPIHRYPPKAPGSRPERT